MGERAHDRKPRLIVVTGRPGAGKSTLAELVGREVRCPVVSRDAMKEGLVNTLGEVGEKGEEMNRRVYALFFETLRLLLSNQVTVVAEAAFQHRVWMPKLEPLQEIARMRLIVCSVDAAVARARHVARGLADPEREKFHDDAAVRAARKGKQLPLAEYETPRLDAPTLVVDTSDGYQPGLDEVVQFARG